MLLSNKTPQCKGGATKVIVQGTTSPGLKTPSAVVFINNDEEERRQRRLESRMRGMMSPGLSVRPQNSLCGGLSSLSNAQIAEHYADCIKLSSENKINSRNAFGLHLIDYMLEMLLERGELENFQVAGCTLDAGAKIYASRVDSIYSDAYKVLGGIGKGDIHDEGQSDVPLSLKERAKKEPITATIEGNPKIFNLSSKDLDLEVDPFFKHMSAFFDEEQEEGLMLCQLITREDFSLVLDVQSDSPDVDFLYSKFELPFTGISNEMNSYDVCASFSAFTVMKNQNVIDFVSAEALTSGNAADYLDPPADYSMLPYPSNCISADSSSDDGLDPTIKDVGVGLTESVEAVDFLQPLDTSVVGVCGDREFAHMIDIKGDKNGGEYGCLFHPTAVHQSEYSYFDPLTTSTWAGLQHWKVKSVPRRKSRLRNGPPTLQKFKVSFQDCPNEIFHNSKNLTSQSISKCTTLPQDVHLKIGILLELFSHPQCKVLKQKPLIMMEDELDETWEGYEKGCDFSGSCPSLLQDADTFRQSVEEAEMSNFKLVAQPTKVQKVSIEYAKSSKRIDAKKLKEKMWQLISDTYAECLVHGSAKYTVDFSDVCCRISEDISQAMMNDVSVPICFVFLLHLANEKGLTLSGEVGLSDVNINSK